MGANRPSSRLPIHRSEDGKQWPIGNYSRISREKPRNGKAVIEYDSGLTEPTDSITGTKTTTKNETHNISEETFRNEIISGCNANFQTDASSTPASLHTQSEITF